MIFILILHGLAAIFLLGAISHQAAAVWRSPGQGRATTLVKGFQSVRAPLYANTIIVAYIATMLLGDVRGIAAVLAPPTAAFLVSVRASHPHRRRLGDRR